MKLLDFGIAKGKGRMAQTTQDGMVKGNLWFLSPEQALGQPLDHRTDLFSLGLVFFNLLTGESAYAGETQREVLLGAAQGPANLRQRLPAGLASKW